MRTESNFYTGRVPQPLARLGASLRTGSWLTEDRLRSYPALFLVIRLVVTAFWVATADGVIDRTGKVLGTDFLNVWAASTIALEGEPENIYDYQHHGVVQQRVVGTNHPDQFYGWHYPPTFLLLVLPLALLPYAWSLAAYLLTTFPAYWITVRRILPGREAALAALAFPGVWITIGHGQNAFLTTGLLGGGLLLLERRPVLAGVLLGLLSYKPQMGFLIPLALAAGGYWRTFAAAAATTIGFAALAWLAFGPETWHAFLASLELTRTFITEQGATGWHKIQSVFSAVRLLGGGIPLAYAVQGMAALAAAAVVVAVWRRTRCEAVRGAALVAATPLTSPYVLDYDLAILALAIAWIVREGREHGFLPWEKTVLAIVWLLPLVARTIALQTSLLVTPLLLAAMLALLLHRSRLMQPD